MFSFISPARRRVSFLCKKPSLTKQSEKDVCDINRIVSKYARTGVFDHVSNRQAFYSDVSDFSDYQSSLHKVMKATDAFNSLSSDVRGRFDNDPGKLVDFLSDEKNRDEAVKLGFIKEPKKKVESGEVAAPPGSSPQGEEGKKGA